MRIRHVVLVLVLGAACTAQAHAAPVFGSNQSFATPGTSGWSGGIPVFNNPGTGGVLGVGDGYLFMSHTGGKLGLRCRVCPEYTGDWTAAGITHIGLSLNDVGADDALEVHVSVGNDTSFWQYDVAFDPPPGQWGRFVVDLTNEANFTEIISTGPGDFATALQNVTVILVRHDLAPYVQTPDDIAADFGVDEVTLGDLVTPVTYGSWGRLKALYRE